MPSKNAFSGNGFFLLNPEKSFAIESPYWFIGLILLALQVTIRYRKVFELEKYSS